MYNPFSLENKTVLVTGASSGIGRAAAIECSRMGAKLVITGRNEARLSETLRRLEGSGHSAIVCDLADSGAIDAMVDSLPEIQGLANNAGYTKLSPVAFLKEGDLKSILQVNAVAPVMLLQKLVRRKKLRRDSSVVFTSSMAGLGVVSFGNSMYAASKGAVSAFIKNAALDLANKGIRVNAVCPGMVNTPFLEGREVAVEQLSEDVKNYPLGRYGEPRDVAYAIVYLLSDASSWITGSNLVIDGGLSVK